MQAHSSKIKTIDPQFLCAAYCNGYFPMADSKTGEINWYSPDPRTIFDLNEFHIPRSLTLTLKKKDFEVYYHSQVPTNDGGVSLGQAVIVGSMMKNEKLGNNCHCEFTTVNVAISETYRTYGITTTFERRLVMTRKHYDIVSKLNMT